MRPLIFAVLSLSLFACKDRNKDDTSEPVDDTSDTSGVDDDGDGYLLADDCDDDDAAVHPGADEACNEIDDNCDGAVDEGVGGTWYYDDDADGYGGEAVSSCEQPSGAVATGGDCDDTDPAYNPGATEADCNDPNDYNCDGSTGYADGDGDGFAACQDCDDSDLSEFPGAAEVCDGDDDDCDGEIDEEGATGGATFYQDLDADTYGDATVTTTACTAPDGYSADSTDCNDTQAGINPGAPEVCDGLDNNCSGEADEAGASGEATWYADADADGYGDAASTLNACDQPDGYSAYDTDCDDTDPAYNPGALESCDDTEDYNCDGSTGYADADADGWAACEECDDSDAAINPDAIEVCDTLDNNCDGDIDGSDAADALTWYADSDADTYGDATRGELSCEAPDGFVADGTDCDDADDDVNPGATEVCDDEDDDCDGTTDEDAADATTWYTDADADGAGDDSSTTRSCDPVDGAVDIGGDCDDTDAEVGPYADEVCNDVDDDCNGYVDDGATDLSTYYTDSDADGYGDPYSEISACSLPTGYADDDTDCDDTSSAVYPGADEVCDSEDNDCDGYADEAGALDGDTYYADADGDGYGDEGDTITACDTPEGYSADGTDCDDADLSIYPGATETCNGYDDDCDGSIDDSATGLGTWYRDADDDGFGDASDAVESCDKPDGYVKLSTDCDDTDDTINPDAVDTCNGLDDDCSGTADDGADTVTWYIDSDDDGYGDSALSVAACDQPDGYVSDDTDCDDTDGGTNPGADELCDDVDNDCDGTADDDAVDATTWYRDADADGHGRKNKTKVQCDMPRGYAADKLDCDDGDATVYTGADEVCDSKDNDCDSVVDDSAVDALDWYADTDADGYGDPDSTKAACTVPTGYTDEATDCDDSDGDINPGEDELCNDVDDDCDGSTDEGAVDPATWYLDSDDDGYGTSERSTESCSTPSGYADNADDCDDGDATTNPDATETCDGLDNDCDGTVDDGTAGVSTWYADSDDDGYGDKDSTTESCTAPSGYVDDRTDCDDTDAGINPGATEVCDGVDDDCDRSVDEAGSYGESTWYADADSDGFGDAGSSTDACDLPSGYTDDDSDCDDTDPDISPDAAEVCNGYDDDCDGSTDESGSGSEGTWYRDTDGDGYGDPSKTTTSCDKPTGYVKLGTDCDDGDDAVYPGATETCNDIDDDCDDAIDDSPSDGATWYADSDGDGAGDSAISTTACDAPTGYVADGDDCDDSDDAVYPGATETCNDADDDCDGTADDNASDATTWYRDADSDSYGNASRTRDACTLPSGYVATSTDCDDTDGSINPGATETCNDTDDDCDGTADDGATDTVTWYADGDSDGYGKATSSTDACSKPTGYVSDDTDCNDSKSSINPGADELCNGVDDDCDGTADDGASDLSSWYADADSDGYGDEGTSTTACDAPTGYIADGTDCDDTDGDVNPGADEVCNLVDDDCDGRVDTGAIDRGTYYADTDGDGYGNSSSSKNSCTAPTGYVTDDTDCDDDESAIYPGATELCGDGLVNDCDESTADALATCSLDGTNYMDDIAFATFVGETSGAGAGFSVAHGGDLNGDGRDDLLIGAYRDGTTYTQGGAAYVVFGSVEGHVSLSSADAIYRGAHTSDEAGQALSAAGDVDGDDNPDILIAAPKEDTAGTTAGAVYLVLGPFSGDSSLASADATITGEVAGDVAGRSVQGAGDWDGDGTPDIAVGAAGDDSSGSWSGKAYVLLGAVSGTTSLSTATLEVSGESTYDYAGRWMAGGYDLDGDGTPDLVVGANGDDDGGATAGAAYVVYGPATGSYSLASADAKLRGVAANDQAGRAVAVTPDSDGDGYPELVVGAWGNDMTGSSAGAVYVFSSAPSGEASLSTADAIYYGARGTDNLGIAVSAAGDVDGDGAEDLLLGAQGYDVGASNGGAAYVVYGPFTSGTHGAADLDVQLINDNASSFGGWALSSAGDTNGDGVDEILVGAFKDSSAGTNAGKVYLIGGGY